MNVLHPAIVCPIARILNLRPYKSTPLHRRAPTGGRPPSSANEIDGCHMRRFRAGPMSVLHTAMVSPIAWPLNACVMQVLPAATMCAHVHATARDCGRDPCWPSPMLPRGFNECLAHRHRVPYWAFIECLGHTCPLGCIDIPGGFPAEAGRGSATLSHAIGGSHSGGICGSNERGRGKRAAGGVTRERWTPRRRPARESHNGAAHARRHSSGGEGGGAPADSEVPIHRRRRPTKEVTPARRNHERTADGGSGGIRPWRRWRPLGRLSGRVRWMGRRTVLRARNSGGRARDRPGRFM